MNTLRVVLLGNSVLPLSLGHSGLFFCAVFLGFLVPGACICRSLRKESGGGALVLIAGFIVSILILFHIVFALEVLGQAVVFPSVAGMLILFSIAGLVLVRSGASELPPVPSISHFTLLDKILGVMLALIFSFLALRLIAFPLPGPDTIFRWDFLAKLILENQNFHFYPPRSAADFEKYFFIDAISPLVSICYWWLYASLGEHLKEFSLIFVLLQNIVLGLSIYVLARQLFSHHAGLLAVGLFYSSRLAIWSTFMGQETGLTALSLVATIIFLELRENSSRGGLALLLASASTALGMLARQYGGIILICGLGFLLQKRAGIRTIVQYLMFSTLLGGSWYIYTFLLTGSPFYGIGSNEHIVQSPVYAAFSHAYISVTDRGLAEWGSILSSLFLKAPLVFLIGLPALFFAKGQRIFFSLSIALLFAIWLKSISHTATVSYSMRVLSPALALLSIAGAGLLANAKVDSLRLRYAVVFIGLLAVAPYAYVFPFQPHEIPRNAWASMLLHRQEPSRPELELMGFRERFGAGKILSDRQYAHSILYDQGVVVVPYWNTELDFILDTSLPWKQAQRELEKREIAFLIHYPESTFGRALHSLPIYKKIISEGVQLHRGEDFILYSIPEAK